MTVLPKNRANLRAELRLPEIKRGTVAGPQGWVPCLIQDFSNNGLLIMCMQTFSVGEVLDLKCELYPEKFMRCKVEVRHDADKCYGTKIVEIDRDSESLCARYTDELYALQFLGRARV